MKDIKLVASVVGATLLILIGVSLFFSSPKAPSQSSKIPSEQLTLDAQHILGPENADITLVEFSDLQCPACQSAHPVVKSILDQHGDKIKLVYRHFPFTSIHKHAMLAALAAESASDQGKFWEYIDILFDQQDVWSKVPDPSELFTTYANQLELSNLEQFENDLEEQRNKDRVLKDLKLGNQIGVNATPTFFVNGEKTTTSNLELAVERVLSKKTN